MNGVEREFPGEALPETLSDLLNALEICHATVVAEIDGRIVERKDFVATRLTAGQAIELVRFVGGG
ncbi:MAG: sulfur carrier protein ThiS [Phycisphaerae bacterium]|nr:sulfur carrier protein ThiS [Phycisphaerae bacterium]